MKPIRPEELVEQNKSGFALNLMKGFQFIYPSGIRISVVFGVGNYCQNNVNNSISDMSTNYGIFSSENAEIAIIGADDKWFNFPSNQVKGWCSFEEVMYYIINLNTWETLEDIVLFPEL
jgi:hypothetical protein